jgi:hypothetical protein
MGILGSAMNAYGGGSGENDRENAMIERENGIREATRIRREGSKHLGVMHVFKLCHYRKLLITEENIFRFACFLAFLARLS